MQKIALLLLLSIAIIACEDIQDNSGIMQGSANDRLFKAGAVASPNDDGSFALSANSERENLTLRLTNINVGTYAFGPESGNQAVFTNLNGRVFSTATAAGDGQAIISQYNTMNNTVTGSFIFNAYTEGLNDTLNFQRGVIFEVPVAGGEVEVDPGAGFIEAFSARVDGSDFGADSFEALNVSGFIAITAAQGTDLIVIRFDNALTPGDYDIADGDFTASYSSDGAASVGTIGTMTILSHNTETDQITGSFSFSGDGFEVTDGSFSVAY